MAAPNRTSSVIAAWRAQQVGARPSRTFPDGAEASWLLAGAVAVLVVAWLLAVFTVDRVRFVVVAPTAKTGFEVILALGQLFGALVLALFPDESVRPRLRWVALGLAAFGLGAFGFGYLAPLVQDGLDLNASLFGATVVRWAGCAMLATAWPSPDRRVCPGGRSSRSWSPSPPCASRSSSVPASCPA